MNKDAPCYGQKFGHNFPYTGADCLECGVNQDTLSKKLKPIKSLNSAFGNEMIERKKLKGIHSELHELVFELRNDYRETAKKGKGSFGFYLGLLKRISIADIYRIKSEVKSSNFREPGKLFWWKYSELLKSRRGDNSTSQKGKNNL